MLSIILPCYNEQDNLEFLFNSLDPVAAAHQDLEIILVNNGSTDNSAAVFEQELTKRNQNTFKVVNVEKNIGYGYGILTGLRAAKGNILSVTHADRQTDPMDVLKALGIYNCHPSVHQTMSVTQDDKDTQCHPEGACPEALEGKGGNDENSHPEPISHPSIHPSPKARNTQGDSWVLVKGYRKNRRPMEAFFSWGMGVLSSLALGTRLTEINAQPKLFSKTFFDSIEKDAPHDFSLDLFFLYHAKKKGQIIDFPVYFAKRVAGEAKGGSGSSWKVRIKLMKRIFKYIFELRNKVKA
jgi:polyisoprenyl-phosphate glycosyltransferase